MLFSIFPSKTRGGTILVVDGYRFRKRLKPKKELMLCLCGTISQMSTCYKVAIKLYYEERKKKNNHDFNIWINNNLNKKCLTKLKKTQQAKSKKLMRSKSKIFV